jgi:hypothetical protein
MEYRFVFSCLFSLFRAASLFSAFDLAPVTGKSLAMGQALSALSTGPSSMFQNPAGLGGSGETVFCLSYSRPFEIKGLDSWTLSGQAGFFGLDLGLGIHGFGNAVYSEKTLVLAAALPIGCRVNAGLQVRHLRLDIQRYGSAGARIVDAGLQVRVSGKTALGFSCFNAGRGTLGRGHETLPVLFKAGIGWLPESSCTLAMEWCKDARYPGRLDAGLEIWIVRSLNIRFGFQSRPASVSFGCGIVLEKISLDWGNAVHPVLGLSRAFSIMVPP